MAKMERGFVDFVGRDAEELEEEPEVCVEEVCVFCPCSPSLLSAPVRLDDALECCIFSFRFAIDFNDNGEFEKSTESEGGITLELRCSESKTHFQM